MKRNRSIQLKAASLLAVFGLNTIIGFACSLGLDMSFNTPHHKEEATKPTVHIHADGKKHHHEPKPAKATVHIHADGKKHEHNNKPLTNHHEEKDNPKKDKDDCCNDDVLKFQNLAKNLNQNTKTAVNLPVFAAIISTFLGIDVFKIAKAYPPKNKVRFFYPPPPDIRIAIQSFQI